MPSPIDCEPPTGAATSGRPTPGLQRSAGTDLSMHRARSKSSPKSADGGAVHDVALVSIAPENDDRSWVGRHVGRLTDRAFSWRWTVNRHFGHSPSQRVWFQCNSRVPEVSIRRRRGLLVAARSSPLRRCEGDVNVGENGACSVSSSCRACRQAIRGHTPRAIGFGLPFARSDSHRRIRFSRECIRFSP